MKSTLWAITFGELGATLKTLQDYGVTPDHLSRLRAEPEYAKRVAEYILRGGVGCSRHKVTQTLMGLMGKNFFGVEDWSALYNMNFSQKQLQKTEFPWDEDILNSTCPLCGKVVKDCHFAFLGLTTVNGEPLTVAKLLELHPFYFNLNPWHVDQPHTDVATMALRYYILHIEIVPNSTNKTPKEQVAMLPPEYEVPTTIAETVKDILVFQKTGVRPNGSKLAACTECTVKTNSASAGFVSCVGDFDERGLLVKSWVGLRFDSVGVGASRKL